MLRRMIQVDSQNLHSVGYDRATKQLSIRFQSDPSCIYTYHNVKAQTYLDLMNAESVGSYFSKNIRNTYEFTKTKFAGE